MDGGLALVLVPVQARFLSFNRLFLLVEVVQVLLHVGVRRPLGLALVFYLQLAAEVRVNVLGVKDLAILGGFWNRIDRDSVDGPVVARGLA